MSETKEPEAPKEEDRPSNARTSKWGCLLFLIFCFLVFLLMIGGGGFIEPEFILLFGWITFLGQTLPKISWNWDLVGMGLLCVAGILFLAHRFWNWLITNIAASKGAVWRWPWRWTWCGLSAVMIFFLVGMATGGIAHQIGWIASSPEPWFEVKKGNYRYMWDMKQIDMAFQITLSVTNGGPAIFRREMYLNGLSGPKENGKPWEESYQMLFVLQENKQVTGLIVFPRDPQKLTHTGGIHSSKSSCDDITASEIAGLLQTNRQNLISF